MKNKIITIISVIVIIMSFVFIFMLYKKNIDEKNSLLNNLENKVQEVDIARLSSEDIKIDTSKFEFESETVITFINEDISIDGSGASIKNIGDINTVEITTSGAYRLSGTLDNGRIVVNAKDSNVNLILDNVNITCLYNSPIYIYKSDAVMITLEDNSANILNDGDIYNFEDEFSSSADEEPNSCLYSKSNLIIYGKGSLTVNANNNNAITSKDSLYIENADITVNSKNHGMNGKDSNVIKNSKIHITSVGDGIRSTNDTDTTLGWIRIEESEITINAGEDAIQAETDLIIYGGKFDIVSGGGSSEALDISNNDFGGNWFNREGNTSTQAIEDEISKKGIKSVRSLLLEDTEMRIDSYDDAIHSNENIKIVSGNYRINTGDDGIHADYTVTIDNGNIEVINSYEGIEANNIVINDGKINIISIDDGININGGNDLSGFENFDRGFKMSRNQKIEKEKQSGDFKMFENSNNIPNNIPSNIPNNIPSDIPNNIQHKNPNNVSNFDKQNSEAENILIINGGNITINAAGDGIDSNGNIIMNNGKVVVYGPTNSGNGALDYANTLSLMAVN